VIANYFEAKLGLQTENKFAGKLKFVCWEAH